jgi:hypothetical protein
VVLIPTKHNSIFSLENAVTVIKRFVPEIQKGRKDGGSIALPIFLNGESITEAKRLCAEKAINEILAKHKKDKVNPIDLTPLVANGCFLRHELTNKGNKFITYRNTILFLNSY